MVTGVLDGKGAVVTGGSRGIGAAIVRRLAADGAIVVFSYASQAQAAAKVEQEVRDAGGTARAVQADLREPGAATALMEAAAEVLPGLDILVNNAALEFAPTPIASTEDQLFDEVMAVGAKAVFHTVRYAARSMREHGRIINISTLN